MCSALRGFFLFLFPSFPQADEENASTSDVDNPSAEPVSLGSARLPSPANLGVTNSSLTNSNVPVPSGGDMDLYYNPRNTNYQSYWVANGFDTQNVPESLL